jgi:hypothetical protein
LNAGAVIGCPFADSGEISVAFFDGGASINCLGIYCASANGRVANFPIPVTQIAIGFDVFVGSAGTLGVTLNNCDTHFFGVAVSESVPELPEPSTFLMAGVGLACLVWCLRRRRLT